MCWEGKTIGFQGAKNKIFNLNFPSAFDHKGTEGEGMFIRLELLWSSRGIYTTNY